MALHLMEYRQGISGGLRELLPTFRETIMINYGNSNLNVADGVTILNTPEAVARTVDKQKMLQVLREGVGRIYTCPILIEREEFKGGKVVRKPINHHGGRGVQVEQYDTPVMRPSRRYYYEEYLPSTKEWRIDVVDGKTFARLKAGGTGEIRNRRYGWTFTFPTTPASSSVRQAAIAAVKTLGLDFGAVDVGERTRNVPVVYEVNTAPQLTSPSVTRWYAERLGELIRRKLDA